MALTERDANRAVASALNAQKTISSITWSFDRENVVNTVQTVKSLPTPRQPFTLPATSEQNDEVSDIDPDDGFDIKYNCNQIRTKISTFVNNGGMKIGEFQDKLRVSARSYQSFMRQNGPHAGIGNNTYSAAHQFFVKREAKGLKMPKAKKAAAKDVGKFSVDDMPKLDGETEGNVQVYDTCDDVRNKINAHLRQPGITQASFCRELSKCQATGEGVVQSAQLTSFLRKKAPMAGNTSKVFYCAYVFFEKLRLKEAKKKSKKREEMEAIWAHEGGVDRVNVSENTRCWLSAPGSWSWDKYGQARSNTGDW